MQDTAIGPGAILLTIAIAAGWVAVAALILRYLFKGIKLFAERFQGEEEQSPTPINKDSQGF